ncbi:unnamed protein product, partial [Polarella glacialis]
PGDALLWHGHLTHSGGPSRPSAPVPRVALSCGASRASLERPEMRLGADAHAAFLRGKSVALPDRLRLIALILHLNDFLLDEPSRRLLEELDSAEQASRWPPRPELDDEPTATRRRLES